jgi:hypothetical protein
MKMPIYRGEPKKMYRGPIGGLSLATVSKLMGTSRHRAKIWLETEAACSLEVLTLEEIGDLIYEYRSNRDMPE